jgi:hypothetical protein
VIVLLLALALDASRPLEVQTTASVEPCVRAAARAWRVGPVKVAAGSGGDVLVAPSVVVTRALEAGRAEEATERDVATVPWVLVGRGAGSVRSLAGQTVAVPDEDGAYEAVRWTRAQGAQTHAGTSGLALVPVSLLAGRVGEPVPEVPPLVVQAAVTTTTKDRARAARFVEFLASEKGQQAFASCR